MRSTLALVGALALAACATDPPPLPRVIHETVEVPVATRCSDKVDRPDIPDVEGAIKSGADVFVLAQAYRAYYLATRPYIAGLEAAQSACNGEGAAP